MTVAPVRLERGGRRPWRIPRRAVASELAAMGSLPPLLAQLLHNRGIRDAVSAQQILSAEEQPLGDPWTMAGLPPAVERCLQALDAGELIAVYGDYDVDGLTATAVLCTALGALGGRCLPFIPHRIRDGYGLRDGPLEELRAAGASLVVTVDCGVTAHAEIERARAAGLDVVVTDHHLVPTLLPLGAVLNPRRSDCHYPFKDLAGCGVAYRLAEALLRARLPADQADALVEDLVELVAIGTLADAMPLYGENRTIVRRGLARLNRTSRPGLRALIQAAGLEFGAIDAERVGFAIAPRLNAAGRIDDGRLALELLLAGSEAEAQPMAQRLNELNRTRQALTSEAMTRLRSELASRELLPAIVAHGDYPAGIVGLLAGKLAEEFGRPVIVLSSDGEVCIGSARTVPGINVVAAIGQGAAHLERYGGHAAAAGLTVRQERLAAFEREFVAAVAALPAIEVEPGLPVDAQLRPATAGDWATLEALRQLEPHDAVLPRPVFLTTDLVVAQRQVVGGSHLRLRLAAPGVMLRSIAFGQAEAPIEPGQRLDVVYYLRRNQWRGEVTPELELLDWRLA